MGFELQAPPTYAIARGRLKTRERTTRDASSVLALSFLAFSAPPLQGHRWRKSVGKTVGTRLRAAKVSGRDAVGAEKVTSEKEASWLNVLVDYGSGERCKLPTIGSGANGFYTFDARRCIR